MVCRALGEMASKLTLFLKARALGYVADARFILTAPEGSVVNQTLLDCFAEHLTVVTDETEVKEVERRCGGCWFGLDYYRVPDGRCLQRDLAYPLVQRRWEEEGRGPLLGLPQAIAEKGRALLSELGMPEDVWFVCLHVREPAHFDEDVGWNQNRYRDVRIGAYLPAIEAITRRGGWVVRIGGATATPLPEMAGVIDCATGDDRGDWLDVFCCARCRFFVGPDSGPYWLPGAFGVPLVGTDLFPYGVWPVSCHDLFIFKPLRRRTDGRMLTVGETVEPPFFGIAGSEVYDSRGLEVLDNTPEEIRAAVVEMLDRLDGRLAYSAADERLQEAFRAQADPYGVGVPSRVARSFLERHPHLIAPS